MEEEVLTAAESGSPSLEEPVPVPDPEPAPEPEEPGPAVEVIRVEELLDLLTASGEEAAEGEEPAGEEPAAEEPAEPEPLEVAGTDEILTLLETIHQDLAPRPFLTTRFEDYSVAEGLLLLLLLWAFLSFCVKLIKGGFSWL